MIMMEKHYLGDGAYVQFDGWHVVLTTENGISTTNTVCLDPHVLENFEAYVKRLKEQIYEARKRQSSTQASQEESQPEPDGHSQEV